MSVVVVDKLEVKYKDFTAVKGISFVINEGEIFGLLGPNGAGKTSTLEVVEGLRHKYKGSVSVLGHDPEKDRIKVQEKIGIMLQGVTFFKQLKVI
jgi:ABC-2 type transport system ATP-binding protein